jgi:hypothetical protein
LASPTAAFVLAEHETASSPDVGLLSTDPPVSRRLDPLKMAEVLALPAYR